MDFNEKLVSLRKAKGFSQEQLADLINVSRQAISKWETAESQPDLAKLILLGNVFEVSLDELCGRTPETAAAVLPIDPIKTRSRSNLLFVVAIVLSLAIGLIGGIFASDIFFPAANRQEIKSVNITSLNFFGALQNQKMHLVFCPSIAVTKGNDNETYDCKVLKIDSDGNTSSYPAIFSEGVYTSDVALDSGHRDFTLHAVISDGIYDYTVGLVKITNLAESSYSFEELWNK